MVSQQDTDNSEPNPFKQSLQQLCKRLKGPKFNVSAEQILYNLFQILCSYQQMALNAGSELLHVQQALKALNAGSLVRHTQAVLLFYLKYRLGHPENYYVLLYIFKKSGSKYPKKTCPTSSKSSKCRLLGTPLPRPA